MDQNGPSQLDEILKEYNTMKLQVERFRNKLMEKEKELEKLEKVLELEQNRVEKQSLKLEQDTLHMKIIEWEKSIDAKHTVQDIQVKVEDESSEHEEVDTEEDENDAEYNSTTEDEDEEEEDDDYDDSDREETDEDEKYERILISQELKQERIDQNYKDMSELNKILKVKENKENKELIEAKKELINLLWKVLPTVKFETNIRVKRMGELDKDSFRISNKRRRTDDETNELWSRWSNHLKDVNWCPFKVVKVEHDSHKVMIDENDEKLKYIKDEIGIEAYNAVSNALMEINEYNPKRRKPVPEVWDFAKKRRATLKEGISHIVHVLRWLKRHSR